MSVDDAKAGEILSWLDAWSGASVPSDWVPGASQSERARLGAVGYLTNSVVPMELKSALPPRVQEWLNSEPGESGSPVPSSIKTRDVGTLADQLYLWAMSGRSRRTLGTYFTPYSVVSWMVKRWAAAHGDPATVVDVGAGVGAFSTCASDQWPDADVYAVDVNPVTLGLMAVGDVSNRRRIRLRDIDYFSFLRTEWKAIVGPRLALGNPPYTRMQLLSTGDRSTAREMAGGLVGSRASLAAFMTAATLRALAPDDGLALLLPAHWLEADYGTELRGWLASATARQVELGLFSSSLFADAAVDAVALLIGPERTEVQLATISVVSMNEGVGAPEALDRIEFARPGWRRSVGAVKSAPGERLDAFVKIRRGTATGANSFFLISELERVALSLPRDVVTPAVHRLRDAPILFSNDGLPDPAIRRWLFSASEADEREEITKYLAAGANVGLNRRELPSRRRVWHDLVAELVVPDVVVGPTTRGEFAFLENGRSLAITNNLYGLSWLDHVSATQRKDILTWLRNDAGQRALSQMARVRGEQFLKLEVGDLGAVKVPFRRAVQ